MRAVCARGGIFAVATDTVRPRFQPRQFGARGQLRAGGSCGEGLHVGHGDCAHPRSALVFAGPGAITGQFRPVDGDLRVRPCPPGSGCHPAAVPPPTLHAFPVPRDPVLPRSALGIRNETACAAVHVASRWGSPPCSSASLRTSSSISTVSEYAAQMQGRFIAATCFAGQVVWLPPTLGAVTVTRCTPCGSWAPSRSGSEERPTPSARHVAT